ncbi:hypothetical protein BPOR_0593g00060 [Botrytis porri]|uniref:Uncharacterized protein n=1 Tax=Botrytis porri TaxID=87229 RepID=A0A4Z1KQM4_9HELO|nr:hypothetical protein BPOR_0593g00060 [Botrytis porri]
MTSKVVFGFHSGYEDVATGLPRSRSDFDGVGATSSKTDLTDAEKMGNHLRIATTLVHEFVIWGGQPMSLMTQMYNRGGPDLPNWGVIKTSCFTDKNKTYQTSRKAPALNRKSKRD